ncbi:MAG: hypothetical protein WAM60_14110 [Candidatus Promineifilaceae bacterium]
MRNLRGLLLLLLLVVIVVFAFLVLRARGNQETGPAIAFCPGPDQYGYRCEPGAAYTYMDADNDTRLYADDGTIIVDLPFPFTFYGTSYQQVALSSNGNLQFTTENAVFDNKCLGQGPVPGMGELIAPYWDDLDLTLYGYLETAVSGSPGSRIFAIEWDDVPSFDNVDDRVTFEVQLFEGTNDIVFLYPDVSRSQGSNGRSATIGLQSELLGNTLQYGCNQVVLSNDLVIHFPHPAETGEEAIRPSQLPLASQNLAVAPPPKGDLAQLVERLNLEGTNALQSMQAYWLTQRPQKESQWLQADINGDGQEELILLLRPPAAFANQTELAVFGRTDGSQSWQLLYHSYPLARQQDGLIGEGARLSLDTANDKTADGVLDVLIKDLNSGDSIILTAANQTFELKPLKPFAIPQ